METKLLAVLIITILAVSLILIHHFHMPVMPAGDSNLEGFTTKREKAQAVYNWFASHPRPTYTDYKKDLAAGSNIVEYEDVLKLAQNGGLTLDSVLSVV